MSGGFKPRPTPCQIQYFIPIPLLVTSLGKALGRGLVGYTSPLPSRPPPWWGMRQWRGGWRRPSLVPRPTNLNLHQSHPPAAPPRKACSWGDLDDPAAAAGLPMSSPLLLPGADERGEGRSAQPPRPMGSSKGGVGRDWRWGSRASGKCAMGREGGGAASTRRVRTPTTSRTTPARAVRRHHNGSRTGPQLRR